MYYEINVSFQGRHLFATHPRSLRTEEAAKNLYETFLNLGFSKTYGYEVQVVRYDEVGHDVTQEFASSQPEDDKDD
jgi:hypothetical protein